MNRRAVGWVSVAALAAAPFASGCDIDSASSPATSSAARASAAAGASGVTGAFAPSSTGTSSTGTSSTGTSAAGTSAAGTSAAGTEADSGADTSSGAAGGASAGGTPGVSFLGGPGTLWLANSQDTVYSLDTSNGDLEKTYSFGSNVQLGAIAGLEYAALLRTDGPPFALVNSDGTQQNVAIKSFDNDTRPLSTGDSLFTFESTVSVVGFGTGAVTEYNISPPVSGVARMALTAANPTTLFGFATEDSQVDGLIRFDVGTDTATLTPVSAANTFADQTFTRATAGLQGYYVLTVSPGELVARGAARRLIHFSNDGSFDDSVMLTPPSSIYDDLSVGSNGLWVFYAAPGLVQSLDPETLATTHEVSLPQAGEGQSGRGIVCGGGAAWVYGVSNAANDLLRIDENNLSLLAVPLPTGAGATYVAFGLGTVTIPVPI